MSQKALLIGVSRYKDRSLRLYYPAHDVARLGEALVRHGVLGLSEPSQIQCLVDEAVTLVSFNQVLHEIESANYLEQLIFYYSGHGLVDTRGKTYLATHDTAVDAPFENGFPIDLLHSALMRSQARNILMLFDCCHGGPVALTKGDPSRERPVNLRARLAAQHLAGQVANGKGRVAIAACDASSETLESPMLQGGFFTSSILDAFTHHRNKRSRQDLSVSNLFEYVDGRAQTLGLARPEKFGTEVGTFVLVEGQDPEPGAQLERFRDYLRRWISIVTVPFSEKQWKVGDLHVPLWISEKTASFRSRLLSVAIRRSLNRHADSEAQAYLDLEELLKAGLQHFIVLGGPGTGKTTTLRSYADRLLNTPGAHLPVYVTLAELSTGKQSLEEYLKTVCEREGLSEGTCELIVAKLKQGEAVLLLDGLDEVSRDRWIWTRDAIRSMLSKFERCQVIMTSRVSGFDNVYDLPVFEILPMSDQQIVAFLEKWFWGSVAVVESFIQQLRLNPVAIELARVPLLLAILCEGFDRTGLVETTETALYELCLQQLLRGWDKTKPGLAPSRFSSHVRVAVLRQLAHLSLTSGTRLMAGEQITGIISRTLNGDVSGAVDALLEDLERRAGVLTETAPATYSFVHLGIRDYLAAKEVIRREESDRLLEHLDDPRWHEAIRLTAAISGSAEAIIEKALLAGQFYLAADCSLEGHRPGKFALLATYLARYRKSHRRYSFYRSLDAKLVLEAFQSEELLLHELLLNILEDCRDGPILFGALSLARAWDQTLAEAILSTFRSAGLERVYGGDLHAEMCLVPGGSTVVGGLDLGQYGSIGERLDQTVEVAPLWVDRCPVTNAQYELFNPRHLRGEKSAGDHMPVVGVTWYDAYMFAFWVGKRLMTEAEWVRAASGPEGHAYAYGDTYDPTKARCGVLSEDEGAIDVMSYEPNGFGLYDMSGNVWEWTADKFSADGDPFESETIKGGAWYSSAESTLCKTRLKSLQSGIGADCGIRCCVDV